MQQMIIQKRNGKKPLFIVLSIFAGILVIMGILTALMLSDPNRNVAAAAKTDTVAVKLGIAALSGEPARLTAEELNGFLSERFASQPPQCYINSDDTVAVYLPVDYQGIHLGVVANFTVGFNSAQEQIFAEVHSVQVGRLPVQPALALNLFKKKFPQGIYVSGNVMRADISLLNAKIFGNLVGLQISGVEVTGRYFVLNVTGNADKLKEFIVQTLPGYFDLLK